MYDKYWVIDKIEKLEIKDRDNDVIIMTFDPELWTLEDAIETFDAIEAKFPNHNFIGIVKGIEFSVENIDSMITQLEEMKKKNIDDIEIFREEDSSVKVEMKVANNEINKNLSKIDWANVELGGLNVGEMGL